MRRRTKALVLAAAVAAGAGGAASAGAQNQPAQNRPPVQLPKPLPASQAVDRVHGPGKGPVGVPFLHRDGKSVCVTFDSRGGQLTDPRGGPPLDLPRPPAGEEWTTCLIND